MRFFTSDTHFGHENIIKYCHRPFQHVEEMDQVLIEKWNATVGREDVVFHLGDFSFHGIERSGEILSRLNGNIVLVRGNHDYKTEKIFKAVCPYSNVQIAGSRVNLSHYPYYGTRRSDERDFSAKQLIDDGIWLLHGHVHGEWKVRDRMVNVGVDQWNYKPVSEHEIADIMMTEGDE